MDKHNIVLYRGVTPNFPVLDIYDGYGEIWTRDFEAAKRLACATPTQQKSFDRLKRGRSSYDSQNGSGFSTPKTLPAFTRPTNVIRVNNGSSRGLNGKLRQHPASFPVQLVDFFVKSYTDEGDTVLDPFAGSGTVGLSCKQQNRQYILIERNPEYVKMINNIVVDK